ncbi:unnamed protein product [Calypogeia fissa]
MGLEDKLGDAGVNAVDPELVHALEELKIDPAILDPTDPEFVLDPEFRPTAKHDEFFESAEEQIPLIDLQAIQMGGEGIKKVVDQIGSAAEHWGFFQVINHGVPLSIVDTLENEAKAFFSLPVKEKEKITRTKTQPTGYFHQEYTKEHRDWKEVFDFILRPSHPSDHVDAIATKYNLQNQWPQEPQGFRDACEEYAKATEALALKLLKLITRSLGLPEDHFMPYFEPHNSAALRLNYYPPCPIPDRALGVSRHRDGSALTVLVQDETGGLQVRGKNGEWIGVKPRRDSFVINLGDLFQVWTNKRYRSIEHQVVVNENKARFSVPLFLAPSLTTDIYPVPELLHDGELPKYNRYNYGYFRRRRTAGNIEQLGRNLQIDDYEINS